MKKLWKVLDKLFGDGPLVPDPQTEDEAREMIRKGEWFLVVNGLEPGAGGDK